MSVARRADVALDTARRALQGAPSVRSYLRERVLRAAHELDYQPNLVARGLKSHTLRMVTLAAPDFRQLYFATLSHSLSVRLADAGMEPVLSFDMSHATRIARSFSTCASILLTAATRDIIQRLSDRQAVVTINTSEHVDRPNVANVAIDFAGAYRRLVLALHAAGRRRMAVLSHHYLRCLQEGWPKEKVPHVFDTLRELGLAPVGPAGAEVPVFGEAQALVAQLASAPGSINAVICENDVAAGLLIAEFARVGLRSPDDVIVVGCDGNFPARGIWTLRLDTDELADRAFRLLQGLLMGEPISLSPYEPELLTENTIGTPK